MYCIWKLAKFLSFPVASWLSERGYYSFVLANLIKNDSSISSMFQNMHSIFQGLHFSFQTSDKLYFVLDYVNGGEVIPIFCNFIMFLNIMRKSYMPNRPLNYSKNESDSNDILIHIKEFSNVNNGDWSSHVTQSNCSNKRYTQIHSMQILLLKANHGGPISQGWLLFRGP